MGNTYEYKILLDGKEQKFSYPLKFKTKTLWEWRMDPPDFSFITGSCNYVNDSIYDRPGKPYGQGTEIFWRMAEMPSDFMLWLGDNVYLREADYSSESGIQYRYMHTRSDKNLQKLLAVKNNYAIWDDHDFGDNNSGKGFPLKQVSYQSFKEYWGNKTNGENNEGTYSKFSYSDADFILLDNRWFRDETDLNEKVNPNKTQLGEKQLQWLFYQLSHSHATFKFVCIGGQFLNEHTKDESFNLYKNEREKILDYIINNKINGVIFLSGDRHHTELLKYNKRESDLGYSLYELTSSAISSGPHTINPNSEEFDNPMRVKSSLVTENNYCKIAINGKKGERRLQFTCFDKNNSAQWEFSIDEGQLKSNDTKK
jgi:alkaline phosphatase D